MRRTRALDASNCVYEATALTNHTRVLYTQHAGYMQSVRLNSSRFNDFKDLKGKKNNVSVLALCDRASFTGFANGGGAALVLYMYIILVCNHRGLRWEFR